MSRKNMRSLRRRPAGSEASGGLDVTSRTTQKRRRIRQPRATTVAGTGLALAAAAIALPLTRWTIHRIAERLDQRGREQRGLDALTGLPNQAEAAWWLNIRLQRARSRSHRLALMVLDLNDFAECNEIFGRDVGDHVLQVTGARMQAQLRTGDMVCRIGSDTFMVIMDAIGPDHLVAKVGERIVAAVAETISYHGEPIQVTASLGFALSQERDSTCELLLDRADRALIQAKAAGRSIVQF
jgi:diguanylate cyclase (GGDEF)-like protein